LQPGTPPRRFHPHGADAIATRTVCRKLTILQVTFVEPDAEQNAFNVIFELE